jgi:hypothetical protein
MSSYPTIDDSAFDRTVTLREAYLIMERFVEAHIARGETSTIDLISYFGLLPSGMTGDPAAFDDYLAAARQVLDTPTSHE